MKVRQKLLVGVVAIAAGLAGCSEGDVTSMASKMVDAYCALPQDARGKVREQVAKRILPHSITLVCVGDPPAVKP